MKTLSLVVFSINIYLSSQISAELYAKVMKDLRENYGRNLNKEPFFRTPEFSLWPHGIVKVRFNHSMPPDEIEYVRLIMRYIEENSCIKFTDASNIEFLTDKTVRITHAFGKTKCEVDPDQLIMGVSPEGCTHGVVLHNLMTILGFEKEQLRPDRNKYVEINWRNIAQDDKKYFQVVSSPKLGDLKLPYDFSSIMHDEHTYKGSDGFSSTIIVKNPPENFTPASAKMYMGQRRKLSLIDIAKLNLAYNCPPDRTPSNVTENLHGLHMMYYQKQSYLDRNLFPGGSRRLGDPKFRSEVVAKIPGPDLNPSDVPASGPKGPHPSKIEKYLEPAFLKKFYQVYKVDVKELYMNLLKDKLQQYLPEMTAKDFEMKPKGLKNTSRYVEDIDENYYKLHFPSGERWKAPGKN